MCIRDRGQIVNEHDIDWNKMSADHFPYRFRQDTGEDNSLGFMKVNIQNPLAIYLHDTNAVSYTHLDVYKRQEQQLQQYQAACSLEPGRILARGTTR